MCLRWKLLGNTAEDKGFSGENKFAEWSQVNRMVARRKDKVKSLIGNIVSPETCFLLIAGRCSETKCTTVSCWNWLISGNRHSCAHEPARPAGGWFQGRAAVRFLQRTLQALDKGLQHRTLITHCTLVLETLLAMVLHWIPSDKCLEIRIYTFPRLYYDHALIAKDSVRSPMAGPK